MTNEFEGHGRTDVDHVTEIVAAYVIKNHVAVHELPALIASVYGALAGLRTGNAPAHVEKPPEHATPVQIRKSITPDALISFIDGKPYKTLKRHLRKHGLDAPSYRQKFGLPHDYPVVAAAYSEQRAALSKELQFGRHHRG